VRTETPFHHPRSTGFQFIAILAGFILASLAFVPGASAHAFEKQTTPLENSVVTQSPTEVLISFTEPIEPRYSSAQLFNAVGGKIPTPAAHVGSDPTILVLSLPATLLAGTYTVEWQNISAADGHPNAGYFAFTVGSQANVVIPSPPEIPQPSDLERGLGIAGRWLGLLGIAAAFGTFVTWLLVIMPGTTMLEDDRRARIAARARRLALGGVGIALVGSVVLLLSQALNAASKIGLSVIWSVLSDTRFGTLWLVRLPLLGALAALFSWRLLWSTHAPRRSFIAPFVVGLATALPFSLNSHAAAQTVGRQLAIAVDWLHLLGASIWVGGLLVMVASLVLLRGLPSMQRRVVYAAVIPRFSTLAIGSVIVLVVTGFYASWLEVGNLAALADTGYGKTLIVKLVLIVPLLALGAWNLLVLGPRMLLRQEAPKHFGRTVKTEALLAVSVLLVVGVLTGLPTARETISTTADHPVYQFDQNGIRAVLQITPAIAGLNKYTHDASVYSGTLPPNTIVLLEVAKNSQPNAIREIALLALPGSRSRWEAQTRDLSVVGGWQVQLIIRRPNTDDWRVQVPVNVSRTASERVHIPGPPPRFAGLTAVAAALLAVLAVVRILVGLRVRRRGQIGWRALGRGVLGDGVVLLGICGVLLSISWVGTGPSNSQGNPVPLTAASVATGQSLYAANCVVCHGANAFGDGPAAATLNPAPADLHAPHLDDHSDLQLFLWIRGGINNTAMPSFSNKLSDQLIWNLVNFIRSLRHPV
jgi:copper transport protein